MSVIHSCLPKWMLSKIVRRLFALAWSCCLVLLYVMLSPSTSHDNLIFFNVTVLNTLQATFRFQFLTDAKAEVLLSQLPNLLALNLSQNKLEDVPTGIPPTLIALDLSFNLLTSLSDSRRLTNLIELKLSNNAIERYTQRNYFWNYLILDLT